MFQIMIRSGIFVVLVALVIQVSGFAQDDNEDASTERDLIVMEEGTRIPGTILRQSEQKIVYEMTDPESVVEIPLRDIYSLNGLSVRTYDRMSSYLDETRDRIEQLMGQAFNRDPSFRVASQTDFDRLNFPRSSFPSRSSVPAEVELYNELGILQGQQIDRERANELLTDMEGPMQLHPERPYLLVLSKTRSVTKTTEGRLSYLDRFRIAHLAAHLFMRQQRRPASGASNDHEQNTDVALSRMGLDEGRANYIAMLCLQREMGLSVQKPYPLASLVEPSVHYSTDTWSRMPTLLRERFWWSLNNGLKRAWLEVALDGRNLLRRTRTDGVRTTRELAYSKPYFVGNLKRFDIQPPSRPESSLSQWSRLYRGSLGYQVTSWVAQRLRGDPASANELMKGYQTDRFYDLESKGEGRRMVGWVVHWNGSDQARAFYERVRKTLDNRPWSLEPGWQGGNHQFYQRGNRRVSVGHVEDRVFLIIAPSASAHNQLFERMKELTVRSEDVNPTVTASGSEYDSAVEAFNTSSRVWSRADSFERTAHPAQRIVTLNKPYLHVRVPSFWTLAPDAETDSAAIRLIPREEPQEKIDIHVIDLHTSLNRSMIGLIRLKTLKQTGGITSVRRVDASTALRQGLDRDEVSLVEILQYTRLSDEGNQNQVQEVLLRKNNRLFVFQLESPSQPGQYLLRTFQEVLRTTSFRRKTE